MTTESNPSITVWDMVPMVHGASASHTQDATKERAAVNSWTDQGGTTAVEYGLIAAGVGLAFIVAGPSLADAFTHLLDVVLDHILGT